MERIRNFRTGQVGSTPRSHSDSGTPIYSTNCMITCAHHMLLLKGSLVVGPESVLRTGSLRGRVCGRRLGTGLNRHSERNGCQQLLAECSLSQVSWLKIQQLLIMLAWGTFSCAPPYPSPSGNLAFWKVILTQFEIETILN